MTRISGKWLSNPATQRVMSVISDAGASVFFVGGCVRNALLGLPVSDIDIATNAHPDSVIQIALDAGLRTIPTGIDHGTVTVVSAGITHEITTFRRDVTTDGRRAVVSFSENILDDAKRRDFTMNALYADQKGKVSDPLGGMQDLLHRRVRFIENAVARIKEDHLRSLRYFRFVAYYGDPAIGPDPDALAAIAGNLAGIDTLSKDRIGAEFKKLLLAPNPAPAVAAMQSVGVLSRVLPGADARFLAALVHLEDGCEADAIRRLAVLGGDNARENLRLSRAEDKQLALIRDILGQDEPANRLGYRYGAKAATDAGLVRSATMGQHLPEDFRADIEFGAAQVFPVSAADLMPVLQGKALGYRLQELEMRWIHSDFELTRSQLLA